MTRKGKSGLGVQFALRSDDNVQVGILGGDVVVRRGGWLVPTLKECQQPLIATACASAS